MGLHIYLANKIGGEYGHEPPIECEVEQGDSLRELIETAIDYWELDTAGKYALTRNSQLLHEDMRMHEIGASDGETFSLVKVGQEPEDLKHVKAWLYDNIGLTPSTLVLKEQERISDTSSRYVLMDTTDQSLYEIRMIDGELKEYRPL